MPKSFNKFAAQGELYFERIGDVPASDVLPDGYSVRGLENGMMIIGHSETGHVHYMEAGSTVVGVLDRPPAGMQVLHMILREPKELKHLRSFDTHEALIFEPGEYRVRIQREYDPYAELARQVAD
ncbi:hypothetical protein NL154_05550 [Rhizobium sp. YTUHZ044]|uniref:hypothetical protein n=1 Tax=Rhizobium sp. YTUHZ044 TaxID=2962678 RepID=UPI003DA7ACFC